MLPSYARGVFICLLIYSFCWWVSLKCICRSEEIFEDNIYEYGIAAYVRDCDIVVSAIELQSR